MLVVDNTTSTSLRHPESWERYEFDVIFISSMRFHAIADNMKFL